MKEENDYIPILESTDGNQLYLNSRAIEFMHYCVNALEYKEPLLESIDFENINNIEHLQKLLLDLDKLAYEKLDERQKYIIKDIERFRKYPYVYFPYFLVHNNLITYNEIHETTKIDDENSISLEETKYIMQPHLILNLLAFIKIPDYSHDGLALENHGIGYHYHYGEKIKKGLKRTNMLLTFNPKDFDPKVSVYKLYAEYHAEKDSISIDISSIGKSKADAIYDVCLAKGRKRGIANFRSPCDKSKEFYPINRF